MKDIISVPRVLELHPKVVDIFTRFIVECEETFNITLRITQGYRTFQQQNDLYNQGRSVKGNIVTNAKGGQSFHNYGLAVDLVQLVNGSNEVNWNYEMSTLDPIAKKYGITWGGNWTHLKDKPHFEINFGHGSSGWQYFLDKYNAKQIDDKGYVLITNEDIKS